MGQAVNYLCLKEDDTRLSIYPKEKRMKWTMTAFLVAGLGIVLSQGGMMQQPMNPGQMMGHMMQGQGMMGQGMMALSLHEELADLLGATSDELYTLRQGGKTFSEIIDELGGNLESITSQLVQSRNDMIDQALSSGTITQVQAERMKARSSMVVTAILNRNMGAGFSTMNIMGIMLCPHHGEKMFNR
jgi:hypothetical protein